MTRFKLTLEYDGRPYVGWQRQDNGPSVQAALEAALAAFNGAPVATVAAGRTDAGVHARGQVAHADITKDMTGYRVMMAANHHLRRAGEAVAVLAAEPVADDFSARFDALGRSYTYRIVNRPAPLTVDRGLAWQVPQPLDAAAMHAAAQVLVGRHDFTTFRAAQCQAASPVKTLDRLDVERQGETILIHAAARSFLHHQVRSMVGCLALVGRGHWTADDLRAALDACDRRALGYNAPPDGLTFMAVRYPAEPERSSLLA
ncbi:tRNA pseudouridine38-40 synthase [Rhodothalassium salexigens DSM 2132]|uniref:tRNA pseudouridine synthase A n=1 Tax=Rhodothalassium salexigens DSM 2132 TaxID=1188247 RepID=A0A4R2PLN2_RHOSA|nr:tRNA pseudouridine(38-40) synthase TruA [Rhodothalassium salexigens]MBB4210965.1 tRNA pseudouridine38-40 synthase [Rhodothalassium salexigens DSM 2132]MBK1638696.1 tRNA pseudouridine(38-40) synthase TruA [Rhodothalassium salexigens DSM 2132]TCP36377.1 tRNA pseudouridine38-40 synthase [Rhodothalassium salexigens DSM 2132]